MKRNSFNVLFFIKKAKLLKNGEASVCMRIMVRLMVKYMFGLRESFDRTSLY